MIGSLRLASVPKDIKKALKEIALILEAVRLCQKGRVFLKLLDKTSRELLFDELLRGAAVE